MIRLIVQNFYSKRDVSGNVYWFSCVQSTKTRQYFYFDSPHKSNTAWYCREAGFDYSEISTHETMLPIREFNRQYKQLKLGYIPEAEIIKSIKALEN